MRRLVALATVLAAAVAAPVSSASVTIGSVTDPSRVEVRMDGGKVVVRFPRTSSIAFNPKVWSAPADDLSSGTYATDANAISAWRATQPCLTLESATDETLGYGPAIPSAVLANPHHTMVTRKCVLPTGWIAYVQTWVQQAPDFGSALNVQPQTINVSVVNANNPSWNARSPNPDNAPALQFGTYALPTIGSTTFTGFPVLQAAARWSKFSPGGYRGYLQGKHFQYLFGSFTYAGAGVWGPGDRGGNPTNGFGRNAYIDTFASDYGVSAPVPANVVAVSRPAVINVGRDISWRRVVGVLTQKPNGTFCYEFSPKGGSKGRTGAGQFYSITVQGPGSAPDQRVYVVAPSFPFGNASYNAKTDKWGTNFSDTQAQELRDQAAQMGPDFRRPVKGTDCAQQLRQLPESFFAPPAG